MKFVPGTIALALLAIIAMHSSSSTQASPSVVRVVKNGSGFQLLRDGQPYFIKGAGGDGSKPDLKAAGANSWRTWGADNLDGQLAEAQRLGMTMTVGIWLGHKEHGFDYSNAQAVAAQKETARQVILRYKDSPALLVWALGNEMESGQEDNAALWGAIEDIAKMAHQMDPNHPTMTVVAEVGGDKIQQINARCPDIDIVGLNTYAGGPSIGARYKAAGGVKPYVVTEYGPPGTWESEKNAWGVVPELTSTEKAAKYQATYVGSVAGAPLCLGSYAFTWGNKQEATATWFGLLLPDGRKLGAVDTLTELWTGHPPAHPCPAISRLGVDGPAQVTPGTTINAALKVSSPGGDTPLAVTWVLQADPATYRTGGGGEAAPPTYPDAILSSSVSGATVRMPMRGGAYRLYAYARDTQGGAAVANVSLNVAAQTTPGRTAALPLTVYGDGSAETPFIPSGYMGNTSAIQMDPKWADRPHTGSTCLQVKYTASDNWGGVVWQNPDNNWGNTPGGWNLTGAKTLSFWARGAKGSETVTFLLGLLGSDKAYHDSGHGKLDNVVLTPTWKHYTIDLTGVDLSRIVTGFAWTLAASGQPITFYLDDIQYE